MKTVLVHLGFFIVVFLIMFVPNVVIFHSDPVISLFISVVCAMVATGAVLRSKP